MGRGGVEEHRGSVSAAFTMQRQGDQVPEALTGQMSCEGEQAVVRRQVQLDPLIHRPTQEASAKATSRRSRGRVAGLNDQAILQRDPLAFEPSDSVTKEHWLQSSLRHGSSFPTRSTSPYRLDFVGWRHAVALSRSGSRHGSAHALHNGSHNISQPAHIGQYVGDRCQGVRRWCQVCAMRRASPAAALWPSARPWRCCWAISAVETTSARANPASCASVVISSGA